MEGVESFGLPISSNMSLTVIPIPLFAISLNDSAGSCSECGDELSISIATYHQKNK